MVLICSGISRINFVVFRTFLAVLVKQANTGSLRSNTKKVLHIPRTNLKRFGDRAFSAYASHLLNKLPYNINVADKCAKLQDAAEDIVFSKEVYMTLSTINI